MPIFELDEGRPVLVQPMQPTAGSFAPDSSALLSEHLTSLFDEQLFPVRSRKGDAPGPHLLALDAAGQPVVVEVVQLLDAESLVRALQNAGAATRLSRTELLRAYEGGAESFDADFRAFCDGVPLTAAQPRPAVGARLLLVCAEVDPEVSDAMAFLRQPGRQVEVLQLGVVRGADGRRYVDVSPLVLHQPARRAVEPASLRLLRTTDAFAEAIAYDAERAARSRVPYRELSPLSDVPVPVRDVPVPASSGPSTPVAGTRAVSAEREAVQMSAVGGAADEPWHSFADADAPLAPAQPWSSRRSAAAAKPPAEARPWSAPISSVRPPTLQAPIVRPPTAQAPIVRPSTAQQSTVRPSIVPVPAVVPPSSLAAARPSRDPVTAPTPAPPVDLESGALPSYSANDDLLWSTAGDILPGPRALPELASLVKGRGAVVTLVWFRERRGQRLVATLRHDGLIELSDGRVHVSPDDAAADAVNAEGTVDGWHAWRIGDGGPTLAEATGTR